MHRLRNPQWFLILLFLAIIGIVPLVQAILDLRREDRILAFDVFQQPPTAANLRAYEHSLEGVNWAAQTARPWVQYAQFQWLRDGGAKAVIGRQGWYFYKPGLQYVLSRPDPAQVAGGPNDPVAAIVDYRDQLAARGIRLVVLPVPNKESVYPDRLTPRAASLDRVLAPRTREVLSRLRAAQVEVIDLFETFHQARQSAGSNSLAPLYLAQDTHWSPAGVRLAAETVARRLIDLGWLRPGALEYRERPAPIRRLGDILRMLQAPAVERSLEPETVPCLQVVRADNGALFQESPDAELLVLGDSFTRIYQRDEPGAAGFLAHLAKALRQPVMGVVNDGGGSSLVRKELHGRPMFLKNKKVLLWEFVERDIGLGVEGWPKVPLPAPLAGTMPPSEAERADSTRKAPGTPPAAR